MIGLAGCQGMGEPKMMGGSGRTINTVPNTSILWAKFNGQSIDGGGGDDRCVEFPAKWQPGMIAKVEWMKDPDIERNPDGSKRPKSNPNTSLSDAEKTWKAVHKAQCVCHESNGACAEI
ncbi:DUF3304 domain-containing protein [Chromobacterium subtsugae]|uniref:DUF3304 domain-containing protein n=1 Tax=Chromobacterium subtsugae TaxID=251747 RepID=UPI001FCC9C82|nr:DUF3304 domain-containing protein [Chromobacterium subtsugae]